MHTLMAPGEAIAELHTLRALPKQPTLALDLETTGLDSRADKIRLVSYQPFHGNVTPTSPPHVGIPVDRHSGADRRPSRSALRFLPGLPQREFRSRLADRRGAFPPQAVLLHPRPRATGSGR